MIERYEQKDLSLLWSDTAKFGYFLEVELALLKTLEAHNIIPVGVRTDIFAHAVIAPHRIKEIEATTQHDVIAFCSSITEKLSADSAKWFHFGCTSSDIIDTALSLQLKASLELILKDYQTSLKLLKDKAVQFKHLLAIGRSHGMYAEPMSFGQKFLSHYCEFYRRFQELQLFVEHELTGKMSGAVGNYTILTPQIEADTLKELGLAVEPVSSQVIPRDRLAKLTSILALFASALERFEIEIRHLHRSDVGELYEGFAAGQKGSSTMPHKKNPIAAENLSGIARLIRSYLTVAHENTLLWHERDISHSSNERLYLPDMLGLSLYALRRLNRQLERLVVNEAVVTQRAREAFQSLSSFYLHKLLPHHQGTREELYAKVQKVSFEAKTLTEFSQGMNQIHPLPELLHLEDVFLAHIEDVFLRVEKAYPI
jgi:adenylosuccinate lyase